MRIVSLVPSLTHLLTDLGLRGQIVGCTKFCVKPSDLRRTSALCGGTKDPDISAIRSLKPTHIIVNDEENKPEHIEELASIAPTLRTFPKSPEDVPGMIREIVGFLRVADRGGFANQIEDLIQDVKRAALSTPPREFLYFIWRNPWMVVSEDTYISRFLSLLSWTNACLDENRYPEIILPFAKGEPDVLLLSTEPFPFRRRDVTFLQQEWSDNPPVLKADGMLCSWYGTMLIEALVEAKKYCRGEPQQLFVEFGES